MAIHASPPVVLRELVDGVGVVSFNRPEKHNAISDELSGQWREAVVWALEAEDVRCVLLRGEGPSFSSGRDMTELGRRAAGQSDHEFVRAAQDFGVRLLECPKPVVAALKGHVVGGAFEIAMRADLRIAGPDTALRLPEVGYGLVPDTGGTQLLTMLVGPARAKQLIFTGDAVDAERALAWGLVNEVVADPDGRALEVARALAAGPPLALACAKQLVDMAWQGAIRAGLRAELLAQTALFGSADYREATSARAEGRDPTFRGR